MRNVRLAAVMGALGLLAGLAIAGFAPLQRQAPVPGHAKPAEPVARPAFVREPNIDRSGSDMRKVVLAADAEVGMCEALCVAIDGCLSFTYVKQSSSVPKPVCRLKDARPFGHESACCVSGVRATP